MKSKKILTILLSLAIMFTFMPAMAFAASSTPTWDLEKHEVTYNGQTYGGVTVVFDNETGLTTAHGPAGTPAATLSDGFYDLNGATIAGFWAYDDDEEHWIFSPAKTNYPYAEYNTLDGQYISVNLKKPAYATSETATPATGVANNISLWRDGWYLTASITKLEKSTATQSGTISVKYDSDTDRVDKKGSVNPLNVYVQGVVPTPEEQFYEGKDAVENNWYEKDYDGAEHTFVVKAAQGYTVSYDKWDGAAGEWKAVNGSGITVKNVADNGTYRAVYTKDTDATVKIPVELHVDMGYATAPSVGFIARATQRWFVSPYNYTVADTQTYNTFDFTEIAVAENPAAKADEATWVEYMKEACEITETPQKLDPNVIDLKLAAKYTVAKNPDEIKALNAKYAALLGNYMTEASIETFVPNVGQSTATLTIVSDNTKDDDISFEGQTKYVYSGKKTTKKGVLKAKKTITVKATADSSNAITYVATKTAGGKITVSKAGKITVKKGLKKGTYKVTVKAKTAAGNGYKAASEKQTYTIVVKK